jgi:hypothetical protein
MKACDHGSADDRGAAFRIDQTESAHARSHSFIAFEPAAGSAAARTCNRQRKRGDARKTRTEGDFFDRLIYAGSVW